MLKKLLWALAPVIASKVLGKRRQGGANTKNARGKNRGFRR